MNLLLNLPTEILYFNIDKKDAIWKHKYIEYGLKYNIAANYKTCNLHRERELILEFIKKYSKEPYGELTHITNDYDETYCDGWYADRPQCECGCYVYFYNYNYDYSNIERFNIESNDFICGISLRHKDDLELETNAYSSEQIMKCPPVW